MAGDPLVSGAVAGAMKEEVLSDGTAVKRCVYTPHSLRATTATLLLDAGVDITKVQHHHHADL